MKFSHSLQFNAVPEWSSKYIAYSHLKKLIYSLQKEKLYSVSNPRVLQDEETQPLTATSTGTLYSNDIYISRFIEALDHELKKIDKFYISQETGLVANYNELKDDVAEFENDLINNRMPSLSDAIPRQPFRRRLSSVSSAESNISDDVMSFISTGRPRSSSAVMPASNPGAITDDFYASQSRITAQTTGSGSHILSPFVQHRITLRQRLIALYTQLSELKEFIELNQTGFSKICKKFDKSLDTNIKPIYLETLKTKSHVFKPETLQKILDTITEAIASYAKLCSGTFPFQATTEEEDMEEFKEAEKELATHLRDHVVWERNTVWKDMMNIERKAQNVKSENRNISKYTKRRAHMKEQGQADIESNEELPTTFEEAIKLSPYNYLQLLLQSKAMIRFLFITAIFITALYYSPFDDRSQKNCFAIVIYASFLWATETIPLFVTSLLVPLLIVVFPVLKDPISGDPMIPTQSSQYILSSMWSSVIMLLLGGFTLAAALSKYNIAKVLSTYILASAGTNPHIILLTNMFVALFASMWVSNVAAPVLCYSIIQPLLRTLPRQSTYPKTLILGIALASNIGGMSSPISSPQNIFSIGIMNPPPSWGEWFIISIPVCFVCIIGIWLFLIATFPLESSVKILPSHPIRDPFTLTQWFVSFVSIGTILLWCLSNRISGIFGEMGIISIIPLIIFFGTGLLTSEDFNNFMWTIVILAMGGTTLGKAVTSSGLLSTIATFIRKSVEHEPIFVIVLIFGLAISIIATFVSHTVAAMIVVPLMNEIGSNLPSGDHSRLLIMITVLLCSSAMGLPTSGFPSVTAVSMIDEVGDRYLSVGTFITRGVPASIFSYLVIVTLGYVLMKLVGF
ncbi:Pho91p NDAI_0K01690 [Naumovozyma dairenensis CBS 421]|uniref:SPX domain-containing protein n=1 Tax=Naumovozyma dairenensis (strain ATCC 10597 / BCRC 20456 / CBS 421 / NBRC 0211 / NRRL Y-12639) TaxID=1071378 RepID=G0WHU9_NAUDC|nr:hypothetical protein NDAI_0K01690 [Naumovozyma dairenensis CBS 421]CCD27360.1 hypothetical protein NDAI_0K01690 [Naumovozyma dairenensis CBS 421]